MILKHRKQTYISI